MARHDHVFGLNIRQEGERRTALVIALTAVTMVVEIAAGLAFGSMALLADGLHMASHAVALGITLVAYVVARRHATNPRFSFGTGKVNTLGGFFSASILGLFAMVMAWESVQRFLDPVEIHFDQAIAVAVVGLVVNAVSAVVLGHHSHDHDHDHDQDDHNHARHEDLNRRAATLHVLADALTSVLAIIALLAGKFLGWGFMDPVMGLVGAALVSRWAWILLVQSGALLLDVAAPETETLRAALEAEGDEVLDLHLWSIGPGLLAAEVVVATARDAHAVRAALPEAVVHAVVEVRRDEPAGHGS